MTRTLSLVLFALIVASMPACGSVGASEQPVQDDRAAVERAVLDYLEALYDADPAKIQQSVHPDLQKSGFFHGADGRFQEGSMTYDQLYRLAAEWNADGRRDTRNAPREIHVLDLLDQTASAKLVASWGIDYLHLARYDGQWKIVQVLWQEHPR